MIFGLGKRAKAKDAALQGTRTVFQSNLLRVDLPPGFWENSYVMGVIYGMSMTIATLASGNGLGKQDLGAITLEVLTEISGGNQFELGQRMAYLVQAKVPNFALASERAARLAVMYNNKQVIGDDNDIRVAREQARANRDLYVSLGTPTDGINDVLAELNDIWIQKPLAAALGLSLYSR